MLVSEEEAKVPVEEALVEEPMVPSARGVTFAYQAKRGPTSPIPPPPKWVVLDKCLSLQTC